MPTIPQILSPTEIDAINLLCDLAHKPTTKQLQLDGAVGSNAEPPPLRLQNLALPARVKACRVVLAVANGVYYRKALADQGLTHLQFEAVRHKDHNFALVVEAAKRLRDELTAADASTGLSRLVVEDGCELNAKAVMFAAERLAPDRFGKTADAEEGGRSGPKVVYNIVINADSGATPCVNLAANPNRQPSIDLNGHE